VIAGGAGMLVLLPLIAFGAKLVGQAEVLAHADTSRVVPGVRATRVDREAAELRTMVQISVGMAGLNQPVLWAVARQPIIVPGTERDTAPLFDTVALARGLNPGMVLGVHFAHFPLTRLGFGGGLTYSLVNLSTSCEGIYYHQSPSPGENQALCASMQGQVRSMGLVSLEANALLRPMPRGAISPYVRGGLTLANYFASPIYLDGADSSRARVVINASTGGAATVGFTLGAGLTASLAPGYQFTFNFDNTWLRFPVVTGAADRLGLAPTATRATSQVVFDFGFVFVIDARRGRRY